MSLALSPSPPTHDWSSATDAELASAVVKGDRAAAEALVLRHESVVRSFLRRVCYDQTLVDDVVQETFLRVLRYAGRYDPAYAMRTWLLTIARRIAITEGQKRGLCADPGVLEQTMMGAEADETPMEQKDRRDHARKLLDKAMATLSAPQREVLTLFYQQQLSVDEVARVMEMPVGTVKSHLFRARAGLQAQLESHTEEFMS